MKPNIGLKIIATILAHSVILLQEFAYSAPAFEQKTLSPEIILSKPSLITVFQREEFARKTFSENDVSELIQEFFLPDPEAGNLASFIDPDYYAKNILSAWLPQITSPQMLQEAKRSIRKFREELKDNLMLGQDLAFDPSSYSQMLDRMQDHGLSRQELREYAKDLIKYHEDLLRAANYLGRRINTDSNLDQALIMLSTSTPDSPWFDLARDRFQELLEDIDLSYETVLIYAQQEIEAFETTRLIPLLQRKGFSTIGTHYIESTDWTKNPFLILNRPAGKAMVLEWLSAYPGREIENKENFSDLIDYLSTKENHFYASFSDPEFISRVVKMFPVLQELQNRYQESRPVISEDPSEHISTKARIKLLQPFFKGPTLLDIGAFNNYTAKRALKQTKKIKKALGVDIRERWDLAPTTADLDFRVMSDKESIPVETGFADSATLIYVLHHLEVNIYKYLKEVRRVLAPKGRLLVVEDTFSQTLPVSFFNDGSSADNKKLQERFDNLEVSEKFAFLFFADWFANYFIKSAEQSVVPGNYRSMKEWEEIFQACGFKIVHEQYLGFSTIGSRNPVSRGFFVLEKIDHDKNSPANRRKQKIQPSFLSAPDKLGIGSSI